MVCRSVFAARCSLFVVCCLCVLRCCLLTGVVVCFLLFGLLFVVCCDVCLVLVAVRCSLVRCYSLLVVEYCVLFVACR